MKSDMQMPVPTASLSVSGAWRSSPPNGVFPTVHVSKCGCWLHAVPVMYLRPGAEDRTDIQTRCIRSSPSTDVVPLFKNGMHAPSLESRFNPFPEFPGYHSRIHPRHNRILWSSYLGHHRYVVNRG